MTNLQLKAFAAYNKWNEDGHPPVNLAEALRLAIGFLVNHTDGNPDYDERAFYNLLAERLREIEERV